MRQMFKGKKKDERTINSTINRLNWKVSRKKKS